MKAAIDNLKQKPKEQKTAVAGGIATAVVALLLIGWAIFYMKHILNAGPAGDLPPSSLDFNSLRQATVDEAANTVQDYRSVGGSYNSDQPFGAARTTSFEQ